MSDQHENKIYQYEITYDSHVDMLLNEIELLSKKFKKEMQEILKDLAKRIAQELKDCEKSLEGGNDDD